MLQKTVGSTDPAHVGEAGMSSESVEFTWLAQTGSAVGSRGASAAMLHRLASLLGAHSAELRLQSTILNGSLGPADSDIKDLIDDFVSKQSQSDDHCSSQLYRAKQELSNLHNHTVQVVAKVQELEEEIANTTKTMTSVYGEDAEAVEWQEAQLKYCEEVNASADTSGNATENCSEAVDAEFRAREGIIQERLGVARRAVSRGVRKLQAYQNELEAMTTVESTLRDHVSMLEMKCAAMQSTVSSLDTVRDALRILRNCSSPGSFYVPQYLCVLSHQEVDLVEQSNQEIDDQLRSFCKKECASKSRPAEVAEIQEQTIAGMPDKNIASVSLLGACPFCEGMQDDPEMPVKHKSGHWRSCWGPGAVLQQETLRNDCSGDTYKAVMCVLDHGVEFNDSFAIPK